MNTDRKRIESEKVILRKNKNKTHTQTHISPQENDYEKKQKVHNTREKKTIRNTRHAFLLRTEKIMGMLILRMKKIF